VSDDAAPRRRGPRHRASDLALCASAATLAALAAPPLGALASPSNGGVPAGTATNFRVTPAFGSYGTLRVSLITDAAPRTPNATTWSESPPPPPADPYDSAAGSYDAGFAYRWTQKHINTTYVAVGPGRSASVALGGHTIGVSVPALGAPVRGVVVGDPSINPAFVPCAQCLPFATADKLAWVLNAASADSQFWGVVGDNWYDLNASLTDAFFARLSMRAKALPLLTVPGNHDFWNWGHPPSNLYAQPAPDQVGYGFMQYYAMDCLAATRSANLAPFNLSWVPPLGESYGLPDASNFFFYNAVGSLGFIGFSNAHPATPAWFEQACYYFSESGPAPPSLVPFVLLLGHWNALNDGALFTTQQLMSAMQAGAPYRWCAELASSGRMFWVVGHQHDNVPYALGQGFLVGGQGVQNFALGYPVFEVHADELPPRLEVTYFPVTNGGVVPNEPWFAQLQACFAQRGSLYACKELGVTWLNQTWPSAPTPAPTPAASSGGSGLSTADAVVIGVVVGGVGLAALATLAWFALRRRRRPPPAAATGGARDGESEPLMAT